MYILRKKGRKAHGLAPEAMVRLRKLSPRVERAVRMYASGCVSQGQAARAVGLSQPYLSTMLTLNTNAQATVRRVRTEADVETLDMAKLLNALSIDALKVVEDTMHDGTTEAIRFTAAKEILDRAPATSKVQRHQVASFNMTTEDARMLAETMAEAKRVREVETGEGVDEVGLLDAVDANTA